MKYPCHHSSHRDEDFWATCSLFGAGIAGVIVKGEVGLVTAGVGVSAESGTVVMEVSVDVDVTVVMEASVDVLDLPVYAVRVNVVVVVVVVVVVAVAVISFVLVVAALGKSPAFPCVAVVGPYGKATEETMHSFS